jgi:hypothetical protein
MSYTEMGNTAGGAKFLFREQVISGKEDNVDTR